MATAYIPRGASVQDASNNVALDLFARIDAKLDALNANLNTQMVRLTRLEERDQTDTVKGLARTIEALARKVDRLQDHQIQIATLEKDIAQVQASLMKDQAFEAGRAHVAKQGWELGKFVAEHGGKIIVAVVAVWVALQNTLVIDALRARTSAPLPALYEPQPELRR